MKYIEEVVTLEANNGCDIKTLKIIQNDVNTRRYIFNFTNNGVAVEIDDTCTARLYAEKPDCTRIYNDCEVIDGSVIYTPTAQTVSAYGDVKCIIKVHSNNDENDPQVLTSGMFILEVSEDNMSDSAIESTNEYTALIKTIEEIEEIKKVKAECEELIPVFNEIKDYTEELNQIQEGLNEQSRLNNKLFEEMVNEEFDVINDELAGKNTTYSSSKIEEYITTVNNEIEETKVIALGRATGYVFDTVEDMIEWCSKNSDVLNQGDNLYIRDVDVPDYWWDGNIPQQLETQKVDLTEYATKSELKNQEYVLNNKLNKTGDTMTGNLKTCSILPSADKTYSLGDATNRYTRLYSGLIELYSTTPFIDFHFDNSTEDYTSRIIESSSGTLTVTKNLTINGTLSAKIWNGGSGGGLLQSTSVSFGNRTINPNESSTITQTYTIPSNYSAIGIIGVNSASTGLVLVRYGVAGGTVTLVVRNVTASSITANPTALVLLARS